MSVDMVVAVSMFDWVFLGRAQRKLVFMKVTANALSDPREGSFSLV